MLTPLPLGRHRFIVIAGLTRAIVIAGLTRNLVPHARDPESSSG